DANTIALMQRADKSDAEREEIARRLDEKEKRDQEEARNSIAGQYHQGDDKMKQSLEESYSKLAGMPETTKEEIAARYATAAKIAGIEDNGGPNPLHISFNGEAPKHKDAKEFVETPKGN